MLSPFNNTSMWLMCPIAVIYFLTLFTIEKELFNISCIQKFSFCLDMKIFSSSFNVFVVADLNHQPNLTLRALFTKFLTPGLTHEFCNPQGDWLNLLILTNHQADYKIRGLTRELKSWWIRPLADCSLASWRLIRLDSPILESTLFAFQKELFNVSGALR